ncbi:MAG: hypothetical protein ACREA4_08310 [Nitrososphaera sp.]
MVNGKLELSNEAEVDLNGLGANGITVKRRKGGSKRGALKFRLLTGDTNWQDYGGKFASKRLNNGEFDYWLVIDVYNTEDNRDFAEKYIVSLLSVSPSEAAGEMEAAKRACGIDAETGLNDLAKVEVLADYGTYAQLWAGSGNNLARLMKEARSQANASQLLYGFMMDRPQNRIGTDGWNVQRGDVMAGLRGNETEETEEKAND